MSASLRVCGCDDDEDDDDDDDAGILGGKVGFATS